MKQHNERFDQFINNKILKHDGERETDRYGIIISYNPLDNTATVALSGQDSDYLTDLIKNVPCPTYLGFQMAAPEPGRGCWVTFKGGKLSQPFITHFYNHDYKKYDYHRVTNAENSVPRYLLG